MHFSSFFLENNKQVKGIRKKYAWFNAQGHALTSQQNCKFFTNLTTSCLVNIANFVS